MTIVKHDLTNAANYRELASKSTYFYVVSEATKQRFFDVYPSEGMTSEGVGCELVGLYLGTDYAVWGVEEVEDEVTPLDFEEFDAPLESEDPNT